MITEQVNADFSQPVRLQTRDMPWEASPAPGVWRRKLDRRGAESGWATSIVRYEAGCRFPTHRHPQGEEFLVLDGVFSDDSGDYPAGCYVRNPPGSQHAPFTRDGCTIFVKLCQFRAGDTETVRIDTTQATWRPGSVPGLTVLPLHAYDGEQVALVRWDAQVHFPAHTHPGGEEILVLEGCLYDEQGAHPAGTWLRSPRYSRHTPYTESEGALLLVKVGHLDEGAMASQSPD